MQWHARRLATLAMPLLVAAAVPMTEAQPRLEQRPGTVFRTTGTFSWPLASPAAVGIDPARLAAAAQFAASNESDSLLVVRHGKLVLERYWNEKSADDVQQTYSGTKSLFVLLIGRAIERGWIRDLDQPVRELVSEMPDEQAQVTFRSILAMESGLENSPEIEALGRSGKTQLEIALERKVTAPPLTRYHYNNAAYRLLFTALERAAGKGLEELTAEEAFEPLAIDGAYWVRLYADDRFTGYQSIRMTPRDYAKSAQIIVDEGLWNGRRYLPASFIRSLTRAAAPEVNPSFGLFLHLNAGSFYRDYNVPERIDRKLVPGAPDDTFLMFGSGGQLVAGIPSLDLVVVRTGANPGSSIYQADNFFAHLLRMVCEATETR